MLRQMIAIDENKCSGCGACADACHEGAIAMVGGKVIPLQVVTISTDGKILEE